MKKIFGMMILVCIAWTTAAYADVPRTISAEIRLKDKTTGLAVPDNDYTGTVRIYDKDGNPVWSDTAVSFHTTNGYANLLLGTNPANLIPLNADCNTLGIQVIGLGEMTPRLVLSSSLSALQVPDGSIINSKYAEGSVGTTTIANGAVKGVNIGGNTITASHIANAAITGNKLAASTITWDKLDIYASAPPFAIVAFYPSLRAGYTTSHLPANWVPCNGQTISVPDPLNPSVNIAITVPNLNGEGRFLRGSTTSGVSQTDAFQGHGHYIKGQENMMSANSGGTEFLGWEGGAETAARRTGLPQTDGYGAPRIATETRPTNTSVIWIMKIR